MERTDRGSRESTQSSRAPHLSLVTASFLFLLDMPSPPSPLLPPSLNPSLPAMQPLHCRSVRAPHRPEPEHCFAAFYGPTQQKRRARAVAQELVVQLLSVNTALRLLYGYYARSRCMRARVTRQATAGDAMNCADRQTDRRRCIIAFLCARSAYF